MLSQNNSLLVAAALLFLTICVCGSSIAIRLLARARRAEKDVKLLWWYLAVSVASATIWSLHFLTIKFTFSTANLSPDASYLIASLSAIVLTVFCGFGLAIRRDKLWVAEAGGGLIGLGIAGVHLSAQLQLKTQAVTHGEFMWIALGILLSTTLGIVAVNRIVRPVTRYCRHGGAFAFALVIFACYVLGNIDAMLKLNDTMDYAQIIVETIGILGVAGAIIFAGMATLFIDQRASQAVVSKLRHVSMTDTTTGLPNRTGFELELDQALAFRSDDTARMIVASIDIGNLKRVNVAHGLAAGDHLLNEYASRLKSQTDNGGFVGKHIGNRFIFYCADLYGHREISDYASQLLHQLAAPVHWQESSIVVDAALGYAVHPEHGLNALDLMAHADLAADRAARQDIATIGKYDPGKDEANRSRHALAIDLRHAIQENQLELYYQPQNKVSNRQLIGFEALLRWHHPEQGLVSPVVFIPLAEETGQIAALGEWALFQACIEAASWPKELKVAVNVATQQLMDVNFTQKVQSALDESGLAAERLELEITESGLIEDQCRALTAIKELKQLGVRVAMDDYGTGYSSLSTLRTFPFDKIKIDREFIKDVETDSQSAAIVRATIALGSSLEIPILAEGVETEDHLAFLKQAGCNDVQGYLFGKPMPASETIVMINDAGDADSDEPMAA